jgi:hypothetical protein
LKTRHSYVRAGRGQFGDRHGLHVDKDDSPKAVPLKAGKEGDWCNTQAKHPRLPAAPQGLRMGRLELTRHATVQPTSERPPATLRG